LLSQSAIGVEELLNRLLDFIVLAFAGMLENNLSALVDDVLRGQYRLRYAFLSKIREP